MNIRWMIVCCAVLLIPFVCLNGQNSSENPDPVFNHPLTNETRQSFNRVCASMSEHRVIKGQFTQTKTLNRLGRSLVSKGNFAVDADRGMLWDTRSPFLSVMVIGGDFFIQNSGGRTSRLDTTGNETFIRISETMSSVFTGNSKKLTDNFTIYFTLTGASWNLGLVPKDSSIKMFAKSIIMRGDSGIRQVSIHEQNGDTIVYELSNLSYPESLNADEKAYFSP